MAYVEALDRWRAARAEYSNLRPPSTGSAPEECGKRRVKPTYKAVFEKEGQCLEVVCELEAQLGVDARWTEESAEYKATYGTYIV
ncbi:hypothetical protein FRC02_003064 [Tulasnella sp. 418]|nr:hypothetical protein FRC02_003064 [Tulasnella sp. 418]